MSSVFHSLPVDTYLLEAEARGSEAWVQAGPPYYPEQSVVLGPVALPYGKLTL